MLKIGKIRLVFNIKDSFMGFLSLMRGVVLTFLYIHSAFSHTDIFLKNFKRNSE